MLIPPFFPETTLWHFELIWISCLISPSNVLFVHIWSYHWFSYLWISCHFCLFLILFEAFPERRRSPSVYLPSESPSFLLLSHCPHRSFYDTVKWIQRSQRGGIHLPCCLPSALSVASEWIKTSLFALRGPSSIQPNLLFLPGPRKTSLYLSGVSAARLGPGQFMSDRLLLLCFFDSFSTVGNKGNRGQLGDWNGRDSCLYARNYGTFRTIGAFAQKWNKTKTLGESDEAN